MVGYAEDFIWTDCLGDFNTQLVQVRVVLVFRNTLDSFPVFSIRQNWPAGPWQDRSV